LLVTDIRQAQTRSIGFVFALAEDLLKFIDNFAGSEPVTG